LYLSEVCANFYESWKFELIFGLFKRITKLKNDEQYWALFSPKLECLQPCRNGHVGWLARPIPRPRPACPAHARRCAQSGRRTPADRGGAAVMRWLVVDPQRGLRLQHRGCAGNESGKVRGAGPHPSGWPAWRQRSCSDVRVFIGGEWRTSAGRGIARHLRQHHGHEAEVTRRSN
jgi:hypothetical protein